MGERQSDSCEIRLSEEPAPGVTGSPALAALPFALSPRLCQGLQAERAPVATLLAVFQALLLRYAGGQDAASAVTWRESAAQAQALVQAAGTRRDGPFEAQLEAWLPVHATDRPARLSVAFVFQDGPAPLARAVEMSGATDGPALALALGENAAGLSGAWLYRVDLLDGRTAAQLGTHFEVLLGHFLADPQQWLADAPLLTADERREMLFAWNDTAAEYPAEACGHAPVEAQARQRPDALAVVFEDQHLTYLALDRRANQLARHLRRLGVGPEARVGVCLARSLEMVVGILGALKAGGAYLPLDPAYPQERLAFMLADAQAAVLLTQERLRAGLPEHAAREICLDSDWPLLAREAAGRPASGVTADNLAYVIYTSGSTGQPKGVMLRHRGLSNLTQAQQRAFELGPASRVLQFSSPSFDASVWETFMALRNGAALCLARQETLASSVDLARLLRGQAITAVTLTPSVLLTLPEGEWPALQTVISAGESCAPSLVACWTPGRRFFNAYGPTETTVCASLYLCQAQESANPPIGYPLPNFQLYVLNERLHPVPVGVPGELHVGGVGLARGYLGRPGLTGERFIPDFFGAEPGARLYKTGDLARYRADGTVEFLGRIDQQVKVRGFRIELGEIEAVLSQHPAVGSAAVVARRDDADQRLVAYLVARQTPQPEASVLRRYLQARLPAYMIPSAFVFLEAMPLMPSGKVDRRALPAPGPGRPALAGAFTAPRNPLEAELAAIWQGLLGLEAAGVHDNFFDLGGHSLLATRVISRLHQLYGVEISLSTFFEQSTIAALARYVETARPAGMVEPLAPLEAAVRRAAAPLSFAQQGLWFLDRLLPGSPLYNIPALLEVTGPLDVAVLARCLDEIVRRHEILRTIFAEIDGQPVQVVAPPRAADLLVVDLQHLPPVEREPLARNALRRTARRPFDLARGPLMRAVLVQFDRQSYQLLLALHHSVFDGWSAGLLMDELGTLYQAFVAGQPSPLADLPVQYADFAVWQRRYLQGRVLQEHRAYWQAQFQGDLPVLALSGDWPRPAAQSHRGAKLARRLPAALVEALERLARQLDASLFMVLLAAFQTLLGRYAGQTDLVVGVPVANRNRGALERLIGFFVNALPFRVNLAGNPTFRELVAQVRQVALGAYRHQDLPLDKIVEGLTLERHLSHNPLFQAMFVLQNMPLEVLRCADLTLRFVKEMDTGTAKFDLTLFVEFPAQGPLAIVEYNTDLFRASTIGRLLDHYQTLLAGVVADPERQLAHLPLLTAAERQQLFVTWNDTASVYPGNVCMHHLFEAQAVRTPDSIALVLQDRWITYRWLDQQSNRLARDLQSLGIGPERLVGICTARSLEMIAALLAVWKAGGAYVPLDPAYPPERLAFMLQDCQASLLLTEQRLLSLLPPLQSPTDAIVCLDTLDWNAQHDDAPPSPSMTTADNLAYVIYTSGSTGLPKGVAIAHRNAVALVAWAQTTFSPQDLTGVLASTSICFDLSVFELFFTLSQGGTVILADHALHLLTLPARQQVTLVNTVPSAMAELVRDEGLPAGVQVVNLAGEPLKKALVEQVYKLETVQWVLNLYGPSEDTTYSTWALVERNSATEPSIGRPVANAQVYLLDEAGQPVSVGVTGELYMAGKGVVRGYLNRPGLTAERFVPNPFGESGSRLYRTGDLARYRPDGEIDFLGRLDHQVKIRGFRIELGEIEAVLGQHPAVQEVVVLAREDEPGDKRLVAYLVSQSQAAAEAGDLRRFLASRLPDYMVPSAFVLLDALPLTSNGKIDRRALPPPGREQMGPESAYAAPGTSFEEIVAEIWGEVLRLEKVGVYDNFFHLGGHSLLVTQVLSRVRDRFEIELPLRCFFESPTVAQMASRVERALIEEIRTLQPLTA